MRKALYILGQLTDGDVEWLLATGARRTLEPGDVLIEQGRPADALSIVLEGGLAIEVDGRKVADRGTGEFLGEMSFVDGSPPSATVRATERSLVLAVPKAAVADHLGADTAFAARFYRAIAMVLSARLRELLSQSGDGGPARADFPGLGAEIDDAVLDNVHLAGARTQHLLHQVAAARRSGPELADPD